MDRRHRRTRRLSAGVFAAHGSCRDNDLRNMLTPMLRVSGPASVPETGELQQPQPAAPQLAQLVPLSLCGDPRNAIGGWITTYAHRFNRMTLEDAAALTFSYWLAAPRAGRGRRWR